MKNNDLDPAIIEKVESYIREKMPDTATVLDMITVKNGGAKSAAYITVVNIEDKKSKVKGQQTISTLKLYREIVKKEKYPHQGR